MRSTRYTAVGTEKLIRCGGGRNGRLNGQDWETAAVRRLLWVKGVGRGRTRGAVTASKDVRTDDKKAVRVECLAWANEVLPPSSRCVVCVRLGVRGGRETGVDEDGIVLCLVELTPGLVRQLELW